MINDDSSLHDIVHSDFLREYPALRLAKLKLLQMKLMLVCDSGLEYEDGILLCDIQQEIRDLDLILWSKKQYESN